MFSQMQLYIEWTKKVVCDFLNIISYGTRTVFGFVCGTVFHFWARRRNFLPPPPDSHTVQLGRIGGAEEEI